MGTKPEYTTYSEFSEELLPIWNEVIPHIYPPASSEWDLIRNLENTIINLPSSQLKYYFIERSSFFVSNANFEENIKQFFKTYCEIKQDAMFRSIQSNSIVKEPTFVLTNELSDIRSFVRDLYDELVNNEFIKCERNIFERHFFQNDSRFVPIEWHGNQNELFYLIWCLHQSRIIVVSSWVSAIIQHFVPSGKSEFTSKASIESNKSKFKSTNSRSEQIIKILKKAHFPKSVN